jgi:hypothetical protein
MAGSYAEAPGYQAEECTASGGACVHAGSRCFEVEAMGCSGSRGLQSAGTLIRQLRQDEAQWSQEGASHSGKSDKERSSAVASTQEPSGHLGSTGKRGRTGKPRVNER